MIEEANGNAVQDTDSQIHTVSYAKLCCSQAEKQKAKPFRAFTVNKHCVCTNTLNSKQQRHRRRQQKKTTATAANSNREHRVYAEYIAEAFEHGVTIHICTIKQKRKHTSSSSSSNGSTNSLTRTALSSAQQYIRK